MKPQRCRRPVHDGSGIIRDSCDEHEYFYTGSNLEILAFIQNAFIHKVPVKKRIPKLISHFNDHLQLSLSEKQIEEKLKVFRAHGFPSSSRQSDWFEICKKGISALPNLPEDKKYRVLSRARELEAVQAREHDLRDSRRTLQPSSASRADAEDRRHRRGRKRRDPWTITRKKKRRISGPIRHLELTTPVDTLTRREELRDSHDPASSIEESFNRPLLIRPAQSAVHETEEPRHARPNYDTKAEPVPRPAQDASQSQFLTSPDPESVIAMLRLDLEAQRIEKVDETQKWRDLCLKEHRRRRKLRREKQLLQTELIKHGGQPVASQVEADLRDQIEFLKASVASYACVTRFKATFPGEFQAKNAGKIVDDFNKMNEILSRVSARYNAALGIDVTKVAGPSELLRLLERAFGRPGESAIDSAIAELLRYRGLTEVLLSLVGAAICSWVLEPNAEGLFQENQLIYPKLRALLAVQDSRMADSLEFAAHMEFVDDRPICGLVVSQRARVLSRRLIACVRPLVEAHHGFAQQHEATVPEWFEQEDGLTSIFKLALDAKVRLLLTPDLYRCVFPVPGTEVKDKIMRIGLGHGSLNFSPGQKPVTGITILPALLKYMAAHEGFTYDRFLPNARLTREIKPEVWIRARVLI
ncbi:hypothetical protein H2204_012920 [Knufia peltigerae]|uniref:Uncharacterized protein n=1 Tax=Knufia peltigerae TaxID=1002370 RepID=A0AA38XRH2_9EURO|nr:hypothetical protein H2204_012920 [Knufia peltigerae]